jgi:F-type H+-transporting ATPase subunit gamma
VTRLAEIEGHLRSMGELLDVVSAMRSLAAMRMQEAQQALPGVRRYAETMAAAIGATLLLMPATPTAPSRLQGRRVLVFCMAEHGFVGGFNDRLLAALQNGPKPDDLLFVLGSRGAALVEERWRRTNWTEPMATRCSGAPETARRLAGEIYRRIAQGEVGRVEVILARSHSSGVSAVEQRLLLPIDLEKLRRTQPTQPPLYNLPPATLLERLMAEYVLAQLTEAAIESLASENAARFAAMASAHDNVSKKLDELRRQSNLARQSEITTELLELITGSEALGSH